MKIAVTSKTLSNRLEFVEWLNSRFEVVKLNQSDKLKDDLLIEFLSDVDCVVLGTEPFHRGIIESCKNLKAVFKYGVGIDNVDFEACNENGLPVHYKKGTNSNAVSEIVLSYAIQLLRNQPVSFHGARLGKWNKMVGKELCESSIGIIGHGNIGEAVHQKLRSLGVYRFYINDKKPDSDKFMNSSIETVLQKSDIITIHIDNEKRQNCNFINDDKLSLIKDGGYLINTSRGSVLDYEALERHLPRLGGVALDVYPAEPEVPEFLSKAENVILSCHICGSSNRALVNGEEFIKEAISNNTTA